MRTKTIFAKLFWAAAATSGSMAAAAQAPAPAIRLESVRAHENFLAGDALRGRGSATPDEAAAAAYVAAQFEHDGLSHAPGFSTYLQTATIVRLGLSGPATLEVGGAPVRGLVLLIGSPDGARGRLTVATSGNPADLPAGADIVIAAAPTSALAFLRAARMKHIGLLILPENAETRRLYGQIGGAPRMPTYLEGEAPRGGAVATLPAPDIARLAAQAGSEAVLTLPVRRDDARTTNAIGYLAGSDPKAGIILLSAHLDHLGVRPDGVIMHGANDDASGTTAVLELARAMAATGAESSSSAMAARRSANMARSISPPILRSRLPRSSPISNSR
jgi:aminopeptidase YwaD